MESGQQQDRCQNAEKAAFTSSLDQNNDKSEKEETELNKHKNDVDSNQLKENKEEINQRIDELCKNIEEKEFIVRKEKIKLRK